MARKSTAGARQLSVEIDDAVRSRLDERRAEERRSLRAVVEAALVFYFENVPVNGPPTAIAVPTPARGRPRKARGRA